MSEKNLKYYLANPDEMPTDPKELERLANDQINLALEGGQEQINVDNIVGKVDVDEIKVESSPAAEVKTDAAVVAEVKTDTPVKVDETKPDGILAKDGKNVIPYSQLESARKRATDAEERAAAAQAVATELSGRLKALEEGKQVEGEAGLLTEAELETLEADSPALAKVLRTLQERNNALEEKVKSVADTQASQQQEQKKEIKSEIQTAIDSNPTLAEWQSAEDQTLWKEASRFDKLLRESPKYADVPFAERFAKVVKLTQESMDVVPVAAKEEVTLTPEQVRAAAAAKLKDVKSVPTSLSDIPGGAPPAVDEKGKVEQMSTVALGQQFMNMSREQLDTYLQTL